MLDPLSTHALQQLELYEMTDLAKPRVDARWEDASVFHRKRISVKIDHIHRNKMMFSKTSANGASKDLKAAALDESFLGTQSLPKINRQRPQSINIANLHNNQDMFEGENTFVQFDGSSFLENMSPLRCGTKTEFQGSPLKKGLNAYNPFSPETLSVNQNHHHSKEKIVEKGSASNAKTHS